ncbi:MAG: hypothetical protein HOQ32_06585 [Lysobacter sp.]|nr:hypothetical protein [Lysobacter sp.]
MLTRASSFVPARDPKTLGRSRAKRHPHTVIPAKAGTHFALLSAAAMQCKRKGNMGSGFRRNDGIGERRYAIAMTSHPSARADLRITYTSGLRA